MIYNVNRSTGTTYGYISSNALHPEIVNELCYGPQAHVHSYEALCEDYRAAHDGEEPPDGAFDGCEPEINVSGNLDGVEYVSSWHGGVLNFFILLSPVITDKARRASPCVPNAGILDILDGDVTGYDVPSDWRYVEGE